MPSYRARAPLLVAASSFFFGLPTTTLAAQLPESHAVLYTMGPGDHLFSKFGHAALCLVGPEEQAGRCYNYGTADFSTPGPLTWAVLRGRAEFWVSVASLEDMLASYQAEDRTIYRQVLPLSQEKVAELAGALATDALPENRRYRYDHFFDNCSTRPRDHIDRVTGGSLRSLQASSRSFTFRALLRQSLNAEPFVLVLAGIFLGRSVDRQRSEFEAMFLPHVLRDAVQKQLHVAPEVVYARRAPNPPSLPVAAHYLPLSFLIGLAASLTLLVGSPRVSSVVRNFFSCVFGTLGSVGWGLAILSPLPELRYNEILLVFLPTDFFLLLGWKRPIFMYAGFRAFGLVVIVLLIGSGVLIQSLESFLALALPVWLAACSRRWLRRF